jgi:hypothetical protein
MKIQQDVPLSHDIIPFLFKMTPHLLFFVFLQPIIAFLASVVLFNAYRLVFKVFLGLHSLNGIDNLMTCDSVENKCDIVTCGFFTKISYKEFKEIFQAKALARLPRLRQKLIFYFGSFYFTNVTQQKAMKNLIHLRGSKIKDEEGVKRLIKRELMHPTPMNDV